MTLITTISLLSVVFAMVVLSEIFKLKKEVRKLNKITKYIPVKVPVIIEAIVNIFHSFLHLSLRTAYSLYYCPYYH